MNIKTFIYNNVNVVSPWKTRMETMNIKTFRLKLKYMPF